MATEIEIEKVKQIAEEYLFTDGGHHKQYALFQILKILYGAKFEEWKRQGGTGNTFEEWDEECEGVP